MMYYQLFLSQYISSLEPSALNDTLSNGVKMLSLDRNCIFDAKWGQKDRQMDTLTRDGVTYKRRQRGSRQSSSGRFASVFKIHRIHNLASELFSDCESNKTCGPKITKLLKYFIVNYISFFTSIVFCINPHTCTLTIHLP